MSAFDRLMDRINAEGYYHPRNQRPSDWLSEEITTDIVNRSSKIASAFSSGQLCVGLNINLDIHGRRHNMDYIIGKKRDDLNYDDLTVNTDHGIMKIPIGLPDLDNLFLILDHKTVVTAHRNRQNRSRDLTEMASDLYSKYRKTIIGCTIMIGTAVEYLSFETINRQLKVLNNFCSTPNAEFDLGKIRKLLCQGDVYLKDILEDQNKRRKLIDAKLLTLNSGTDAESTWNEMISKLQIRTNSETTGYDIVAINFVKIGNIQPCISVDSETKWIQLHAMEKHRFHYENALNQLVALLEPRF